MKKFDVGAIGKRFGRLVVTERAGSNRHKKALVACICDCGNKIVAVLSNVKNNTRSCGCLRNELNKKRCGTSAEEKRIWRKAHYNKLKNEGYFQSQAYKITKNKWVKENLSKGAKYEN